MIVHSYRCDNCGTTEPFGDDGKPPPEVDSALQEIKEVSNS